MASSDASKWYECDFDAVDVTSQLLLLVQANNTLVFRSLRNATGEAKDADDRRILKSWANIQTVLGERLAREHDDGLLTDDQYNYILDWLANWVEYCPDEAGELLRAWLIWTGRWREYSTQPATTADMQR